MFKKVSEELLDYYMHGFCQYFALEIASQFNCQVGFWLDADFDIVSGQEREVLVHAYAIFDDFCFDAGGIFNDVTIEDEKALRSFDYNLINIKSYSLEEAQEVLNRLGVPFQDANQISTVKKNIASLDLTLLPNRL